MHAKPLNTGAFSWEAIHAHNLSPSKVTVLTPSPPLSKHEMGREMDGGLICPVYHISMPG